MNPFFNIFLAEERVTNMYKFSKFSINTIFNLCKKNLYHKNIRSSSDVPNTSRNYRLLLVIPVASFGLGTWQIYRLQWKKGKIRELESRTQAEPIPLPDDILNEGKISEMNYRNVLVQGHFDHTKEIYIGPRPLNKAGQHPGGGGLLSGRSQSGYQIVTPFVLDNGDRILVNRGWVPKNKKDPSSRLEGQILDHIKLTGIIRSGEQRPQFTPKIADNASDWHYCDVERIASILNTLPVLIDADSRSTVPNGPIGGQTTVTLRNEHLQYIITWYSLCALTLLMYYQLQKRPGAMYGGPKVRN